MPSAPLRQRRPTVLEVLPMVKALYATHDGACGCCLHIVLDDDDNPDRALVEYCLQIARERDHPACIVLAETLLQMSEAQRAKLYRAHWAR